MYDKDNKLLNSNFKIGLKPKSYYSLKIKNIINLYFSSKLLNF